MTGAGRPPHFSRREESEQKTQDVYELEVGSRSVRSGEFICPSNFGAGGHLPSLPMRVARLQNPNEVLKDGEPSGAGTDLERA